MRGAWLLGTVLLCAACYSATDGDDDGEPASGGMGGSAGRTSSSGGESTGGAEGGVGGFGASGSGAAGGGEGGAGEGGAAGNDGWGGAGGTDGSAGAGGADGSAGAGGSGGLSDDAVDVLVLFDVSGSTCSLIDQQTNSCAPEEQTKLAIMKQGLLAFVEGRATSGMAFGLEPFGNQPIGDASCDPVDYDDPLLPMAPISENQEPLGEVLATLAPTGETPTGAALRGACDAARTWQEAQPSRMTVVLLITDDDPEADVSCPSAGCCPTLEDAVLAAEECLEGSPSIETHVVGVGLNVLSMFEVAEAGGGEIYYVAEAAEMAEKLDEFYGAITQ
jgi:hypothetical protein